MLDTILEVTFGLLFYKNRKVRISSVVMISAVIFGLTLVVIERIA